MILFSFADAQVLQGTSTILIPSGGGTNTLPNNQITKQMNLTTNGSVTLSTGYTLAYTSLPSVGVAWTVYCDFSNLNSDGQTVTVFGRHPLADFSGLNKFYINYWVAANASGAPTLYSVYVSQASPGGGVNTPIKFNSEVTFYDSVHLHVSNPIVTGAGVVAVNDSGTLGYGCTPWCTSGNSGLNGSVNFIGTIDTASFSFRVNNQAAGIISYNLGNTALGGGSLLNNTGMANSAFGLALRANTSGSNNTAVGNTCLQNNTTGGNNTAIGVTAGSGIITGGGNVFIGYNATGALSSTSNAIAIGNVASAAALGVAIGFHATASSNQLAITGVENVYLPGMNNHLGYALIDTSGTGNFVPQPVPFNTPIIDTVTGTSSQTFTLSNNQTNILTASTTVAGATLAFPAVQSGTIIVIWKIQTTTTVASGTNTSTISIPSTVAAGVSRTFVCTNGNWY